MFFGTVKQKDFWGKIVIISLRIAFRYQKLSEKSKERPHENYLAGKIFRHLIMIPHQLPTKFLQPSIGQH